VHTVEADPIEVTCPVWRAMEAMQGKIAAEIRVMLGEGPYAVNLFDETQIRRRIKAMAECAAKATTDTERHDSWTAMHREMGWVSGETFDPVAKTHPNLVEWEELPSEVKSKARIFDIVSKTALELSTMLKGCDSCTP